MEFLSPTNLDLPYDANGNDEDFGGYVSKCQSLQKKVCALNKSPIISSIKRDTDRFVTLSTLQLTCSH